MRRFVDIVNFEFDDLDYITEREQPLRVGKPGKSPGGIVVVESGVKNSCYTEAAVLWNQSERSQFPLRTRYQHYRVNFCAKFIRHFFAEDDGRHGSAALPDRLERIGILSI